MSGKLSDAQRRVLSVCDEHGQLFRYDTDGWNWFSKHPQGYVSKAATNPTIRKLVRLGLVQHAGFGIVTLTNAGRAHIAKAQPGDALSADFVGSLSTQREG